MISIKYRNISVVIIALFIVLVFALNVLAVQDFDSVEKALNDQTVESVESPNLFLNFVKLVFILGLIVAACWSIIRFFGQKASAKLQGTWIHVVDEVMLGQNRGIVLCEAGEKIYAIGVTDHNISVLFEVDNPKLLEEINQSNITMGNTQPTVNWKSWKGITAKILTPRKSVVTAPENFHTLITQQAERLEEISYRGILYTEDNPRRSDNDE